jgi:class 3 adenylate cyclase
VHGLPTGTVAFLFTDVEGSTDLWERDAIFMDAALVRHDEIIRAAVAGQDGHLFSSAGDSFAAAFATALEAVVAAIEAQRAMVDVGLRVRMGVHVGDAHERHGDYFGRTVNRTARLMSAAHGGQIVVSNVVAEIVGNRVCFEDLGYHSLRDVPDSLRIWQVTGEGLDADFPPLRSVAG